MRERGLPFYYFPNNHTKEAKASVQSGTDLKPRIHPDLSAFLMLYIKKSCKGLDDLS